MPQIKLEIANVSKEQKQKLAKELTRTCSEITGIREESFVVYINEYGTENIAVGGVLLADKNK